MYKKRLFLCSLVMMAFTLIAQAQAIEDGFYRVRNYGSDRYIFITDKYGDYDMNRDIGDFSALQLWRDMDVISDVSTIIYVSKKGDNAYDLQGEGTGVYQLVKRYVNIYPTTSGVYKGTFQVYATEKGVTKYLTDNEMADVPNGTMGTSGMGAYRQWEVMPVSVTSEDNYFGITPNVKVGDKYYYPMYAAFDFDLVSEGMKAYTVAMEESCYYLEELTGTIPSGSPVIIECASPNATDNRIDIRSITLTPLQNCLMSGVYFCNPSREALDHKDYDANWYPGVEYNPATMRVLGITSEGKLGFVNSTANLKTFRSKYYLPANQGYLPCSGPAAPEFVIYLSKGDIPSAIDNVHSQKKTSAEYSDLSGRVLKSEPTKGLYIHNGKKFIK